MRDYVSAVRAVWKCWQDGTPLDFESDHCRLNLMVPLFDPGPVDHPSIPIHLAAVNRYMCRIAGEVTDWVRPHPVCTPSYIKEVMLPEVRRGAEMAGRDAAKIAVCIKPLLATAATEADLQPKIRDVRARVSFYASTPGYRAAFDHHSLSALADELEALSRAQRWEEIPAFIDDETLHLFATIGTYDRIGDRLFERYGSIVTDAEFSIPVTSDEEREILTGLVAGLKARPPPGAAA